MRKLALLFLLLSCFGAKASSDLFNVDFERIKSEMRQLDELESFVLEHQITYSQLAELHFDDPVLANLSGVVGLENINSVNSEGTGNYIISFCTGFCCGVPGIALVFFLSREDLDYTKAAIIGGLVAIVGFVVYYFVLMASLSSAYGGGFYF